MQIGKFIEEVGTTRETIRYYIEEGLLTPDKKAGKYLFSPNEIEDFKSIRELREMGLSIKIIKTIKANKDYCGTDKQWQSNLKLIEDELKEVNEHLKVLQKQKETLTQVKYLLEEKVNGGCDES